MGHGISQLNGDVQYLLLSASACLNFTPLHMHHDAQPGSLTRHRICLVQNLHGSI